MKKVFANMVCLLALLFIYSCDTPLGLDDFEKNIQNPIPQNAKVFIEVEYQDYDIRKVKTEDFCGTNLIYEVELEDGPGADIDLYFDQDWKFLFSGSAISKMNLPAEVLKVIESFTELVLSEDDLEILQFEDDLIRYKVKLSYNGEEKIELIINQDGSIYCTDSDDDDDDSNDDKNDNDSDDDDDDSNDDKNDDDSDDDDDDSNDDKNDDDSDDDDDSDNGSDDNDEDNNNLSTIPNAVLDFIQTTYPGYQLESFEKEDLCDDQYFFEIELEDGPGKDLELYFTLDWVFAFELHEISLADLPGTVKESIEQNYSNYQIETDDLYQLINADGSLQYLVELEPDSGSDLEVIFNADGSIDCIDD